LPTTASASKGRLRRKAICVLYACGRRLGTFVGGGLHKGVDDWASRPCPEFVAFELTEWLEELGAATFHIDPGKPWQSGCGESLGARLRDERLNMEELWSLPHARALIEAWRIEYNSEHLHSSLGYLTPDEFAARCAAALDQDAA
jgi:transposase InsO family protein